MPIKMAAPKVQKMSPSTLKSTLSQAPYPPWNPPFLDESDIINKSTGRCHQEQSFRTTEGFSSFSKAAGELQLPFEIGGGAGFREARLDQGCAPLGDFDI